MYIILGLTILISLLCAIRHFGFYKFLAGVRGILTCHFLIESLKRDGENESFGETIDQIVYNDPEFVGQIMEE